MMPDGAEPCRGYQKLSAHVDALEIEKEQMILGHLNAEMQIRDLTDERDKLRLALNEAAGVLNLLLLGPRKCGCEPGSPLDPEWICGFHRTLIKCLEALK